MNTSELIKKLEKIIETNGNLIIKINGVEFGDDFCNCKNINENISDIEINKDFILLV